MQEEGEDVLDIGVTPSARWLILGLATLLLMSIAAPASHAATKQYITTTIRGTLTDPANGKPIAGALFRFTPTDPENAVVEAVTDLEGRFEARGLGFGFYAIEIQTAAGEIIRGINELPIRAGKPIELELTLSDRVRSSTDLINQPQRFAAVVQRVPGKWKRFWKQFGIFAGLAAGSGAAVF